jgi:indole-3-glycerol phosphate synthase
VNDFLASMALSSKLRVMESLKEVPEEALAISCLKYHPVPLSQKKTLKIIAEIKKRSPADGLLANENFDIKIQSTKYINANVAAISVLTEPDAFYGSLNDLAKVSVLAKKNNIPTLRKDFIIDVYQLYEARQYGASGVLLIVKILSDELLLLLITKALSLKLFLLIECFDEQDINRLKTILNNYESRLNHEQILLGINCRNLTTLKVNKDHFQQMSTYLFGGYSWIAESGIADASDLKQIIKYGYGGALIGSALMKAVDPSIFTNIDH